ncbi:MAG TPA: transcriptional regulator NrdR [Candidatus Dormibacteraeota bacterium]|nr:transcriptional regulator NrdR [Candidatus Dormibacteraeota bacterium]
MKCPYCQNGDSKVVDSRDSETGEAIRRRRECLRCGKRFTTYERVEAAPVYVVKKDGRREEFDRHKLLGGLLTATKKRDIARSSLETIVDEIEHSLRGRGQVEIPSREVGEMVMERLRALDEIAYIRFASVYRSFKDATDMRATIEDLLAQPPGTRRPEAPRRPRAREEGGDVLPLDMGK